MYTYGITGRPYLVVTILDVDKDEVVIRYSYTDRYSTSVYISDY